MNAIPNGQSNQLKSVLILEDEPHIADLIELTLKPLKVQCIKVSNVSGARSAMKNSSVDLVLIDWMLPGEQGIEFLTELHQSTSHADSWTQTMMITAKGDTSSIVSALNQGADDYVVKPFVPDILLARVQNLLRRSDRFKIVSELSETGQVNSDESLIEHAGLEIDFDRVEVHIKSKGDSNKIQLTQSEFKLLGQLLKSKGKVLSREHLIEKIQGTDVSVTNRTIDTHVFALRKKLGTWSNHIETIRGVGYRVHFNPILESNDSADFNNGEIQ